VNYEYQKEGSEALKKKFPWWTCLSFRRTNDRGMLFFMSSALSRLLGLDFLVWFPALDRKRIFLFP
jgi:hypothetical protein